MAQRLIRGNVSHFLLRKEHPALKAGRTSTCMKLDIQMQRIERILMQTNVKHSGHAPKSLGEF